VYCPRCGAPNDVAAVFCSRCGTRFDDPRSASQPVTKPATEKAGVGALGVLFFCLPLVGAVMYFVWRDEKPAKSRQACTLALWGFGVIVLLQILYSVLSA
jgi:uncharacterized membrane protein YvbJ